MNGRRWIEELGGARRQGRLVELMKVEFNYYFKKRLVARVQYPSSTLHMDKNVLCLLKTASYVIVACNLEFP